MNTHVAVSDMRRDISRIRCDVSEIRAEIGSQVHSVNASRVQPVDTNILGESPPPLPRACFGRGKLIEKIVGLAESLTPIALIGVGGIGKTSIALAVLHHDRVKKRFGDNRRFIRCDQFPATRTHFLNRLSKVVGAGIENPDHLASLQPFLSSREMVLFLDNAESILDPQGNNAQEIYATVEELSQFDGICLCFTSRISTIPPTCETLEIPTLSIEAARDAFYRIYKNGGQSGPIDGILGQLDCHPLSITLLATVAQHNKWDIERLTKEWGERRTDVLRTRHNNSLAATVELSLASPMFQELGPDARDLLGIVAFFPQGINENNLDWLFPTIPDRRNTFDCFCILSLTYRSSGFVTMLAPLRDYLCIKDPASSLLLYATRDCYFRRLAVDVGPSLPSFQEALWIASEDVNVEHLLDVFTSVDPDSVVVWDACAHFMEHLCWHKRRLVALGPKIKGLPNTHPSKPQCLFQLSRLFTSIGNHPMSKPLLTHALNLWRERGDDFRVAHTLRFISDANEMLGLRQEGMQCAEEALGIYKRLNHLTGQAGSLERCARFLYDDKRLDAAEEATSRALNLFSAAGEIFPVCGCYRLLGRIYHSKGETETAINHFETALAIAAPFNWHDQLFWNSYSLALLFSAENRFDDAHARIERAKSHANNDAYLLGRAMQQQATFWYKQGRFEEAKSEALRAIEAFEKLGAMEDLAFSRADLRYIEEAMNESTVSHR